MAVCEMSSQCKGTLSSERKNCEAKPLSDDDGPEPTETPAEAPTMLGFAAPQVESIWTVHLLLNNNKKVFFF